MKPKKPYVWVNNADDPDHLELQICIKGGTFIASGCVTESEDDERLVLEVRINNSSGSDFLQHPLHGAGTHYNPSIHRKITVKITQSETLKGLCTVMPSESFFS